MRSWRLDRFVEKYNTLTAARIWGVSRQAVDKAIEADRSIQIIEIDGFIEVRESKILNMIESSEVLL